MTFQTRCTLALASELPACILNALYTFWHHYYYDHWHTAGTIMRSLGQNPTVEEIRQMVDVYDTNGDGEVSIDVFVVL